MMSSRQVKSVFSSKSRFLAHQLKLCTWKLAMARKPGVVIIGAGAAGIAAATRLLENGFSEITLLEAENRIGGRIYSVPFGGSTVDLGGQWVHGEKGNVVYEMVKDLDLLSTSHNNYQDNTYYVSNGSVADKSITDRLHKIGLRIIEDEERAKGYPGPFGNYFQQVYNEDVANELGSNKEVAELADLMERWFHKFFCCLDSAKTWFDVSTAGAFAFEHCEGDQQLNWRDKGYCTILDVLMKKTPDIARKLPLDDKVFLNKEVTKIIWDENGIKEGGVTVNCADGSCYSADHAIVTVSVGVLKEIHDNMFTPRLPLYKVNSIEGIALGTVNKILLRFSTKWWPNDLKGFSLLWTDEDRINLVNECPHFEPADKGRSWLEDVFGFYVIDSHPRVLLGWVVGNLAAQVELLSDEVVISSCMFLLKKFVGNKYEITEVEEVLRSKWSSNRHFRGSYTHVSIEAENKKASAEDLARPLVSKGNKQTVLFAGEATSATHYSTVHGAIGTGYREADRLISMYKKAEHRKVVIVGAGMAGLGAATKLQELNFGDFLIVEAQDGPGGRIKTITVQGKPLDIGAQWLHGRENPLYHLAVKHDLLSEEMSEERLGIFVRNDGVVLDEFLVKRVDFEIGKILEECQNFVDEADFPASVEDFMEEKFCEYLASSDDSQEVQQMKLELFDWHLRFQIIDNSCLNMKCLSAKGWGKYICLDDEAHLNLKHGYKSLVDVIVNSLPDESIVLNTAVCKIDYSDRITLTCSNDKIISCDHLILTASLGVLKDFYNFTPPLSTSFRNCISDMGFHAIGKIYLFFDEKWWGNLKGIQFIWKLDAALEEDEKWMRYMTGFDEVFGHPDALIGWVGGDGVKDMEALSEEEVGNACANLLRRFVSDRKIPQPTRVIRTKWLSDPWTKGSYCHITPECDRSESGIEKLAEPVYVDGVPRILLAGEAVHSSHYSTTDGAYESGQHQAAFLHDYISTTTRNNSSSK